jgi:hypothetical protein
MVRLGVAGAVLAFVVLGVLQALTVPAFSPIDEPSHYGYAAEVGAGRLPTIDTPIPAEGNDRLQRVLARRDDVRRSIWTANHPPLFYALEAVPVRIGIATGHPVGGLLFGRVLSVLLSAAGIALVALLARMLVPARPAVAVAAAGLAALLPTFVSTSAVLYNDSLAFLTSTALLCAALAWLTGRATQRLLVLVAVAAGAAALTRASGLVVVGVAGLAVLGGSWLGARDADREQPGSSRGVAGWVVRLGPGVAVGAVAIGVSGWFWLRNLALYGDLTGQGALLERFGRASRGSAPGMLRRIGFWLVQQSRLWDPTYDLSGMGHSPTRRLWLLGLVPLAGLVVAGAAWLRRRRAGTGHVPGPRALLAWGLGLVLLALLQGSVASFAAAGGGAHVRYLFPALGVLATCAAVGLAALPGGRRGLPAAGLLAAMLAANLWTWELTLKVLVRPPAGASAVWTALDRAAIPLPGLLLALSGLLLAVAMTAVAFSLWRLGTPAAPVARPAEPAPRPTPVRA